MSEKKDIQRMIDEMPDLEEIFKEQEKYRKKPRRYTATDDFAADDDWEDDSFYTAGPDEFEG